MKLTSNFQALKSLDSQHKDSYNFLNFTLDFLNALSFTSVFAAVTYLIWEGLQ